MATRRSSRSPARVVCLGFSLVELLVVIGIIAVLISILLPALAAIRSRVRASQCQDNVRRLVQALNIYASENEGHYPPNQNLGGARLWYDAARIGSIISTGSQPGPVEGGFAVCPEDDLGRRSYAMNVWGSSAVDANVRSFRNKTGCFWKADVPSASKTILVSEDWGTASSQTMRGPWWVTTEPFGFAGTTPGLRFGGGTGVPKMVPVYGRVYSELPYLRHRGRGGPGLGTAPCGRVSIGYADGHVELKSDTDLVDVSSGKSRLDSLWSPLDPTINN